MFNYMIHADHVKALGRGGKGLYRVKNAGTCDCCEPCIWCEVEAGEPTTTQSRERTQKIAVPASKIKHRNVTSTVPPEKC
jgi:uncharacterized Fe-S cluster-containing radical SAM superfamily enzyme